MRNANGRAGSFFRGGVRTAVVTSILFVMFLFTACNTGITDLLSGQADVNALRAQSGPQVTAGDSTALAVPLGSASTFAVLGFAGVTNADASVITGDLGVGPGAPSATGFDLINNTIVYGPGGTVTTGLGIVNGTIYAGGPVADQAQLDAVIAYNYLKAQVPDTVYSGVTQLDGMTFTPGVYSFAPSANLQVNGTVTLDFQGNSDALFIFQLGTTLVTMADSQVVAINTSGDTCSGSNVYWAVGSSATIDGAQFLGSVIAHTAITMTSAANTPPDPDTAARTNVAGRMFALGASVTMVNSTIAVCGTSGGGEDPVPPKPCDDFVTGGGWIVIGSDSNRHHKSDKATFGVSGGIHNGDFWGQLSYDDHSRNGVKVKSTEVTGYFVIDAVTRQIEGIAKVNRKGSFTYTVIVADNGEPGRNDTFSLEIFNDDGSSYYSASGTLKGGNIQLHWECGKSRDHDRHDGRDCDDEHYKQGGRDHDSDCGCD